MNSESLQYYAHYYDAILFQTKKEVNGNYQVVDNLSSSVISNPLAKFMDSKCECRYCHKTKPAATFRDKAHAFPEFLGNKLFVNKDNECDDCNHFFGDELEPDLNAFMKQLLVVDDINGKGGSKKYKSFNKMGEITHKNGSIEMSVVEGYEMISDDPVEKKMKTKIDIPTYSLRSAYKAILKMALSILPENEISDFNFAFSSLKNNDIFGSEYIILNYYPGFNRMPFSIMLNKRKNDSVLIPKYQFAVMNNNFLLQVPIFSDNDISIIDKNNFSYPKVGIPTIYDIGPLGDVQTSIHKLNLNDKCERHTVELEMNYDAHELHEGSDPLL
jgi:hypothetical protein